jgi:hypothetical protein
VVIVRNLQWLVHPSSLMFKSQLRMVRNLRGATRKSLRTEVDPNSAVSMAQATQVKLAL